MSERLIVFAIDMYGVAKYLVEAFGRLLFGGG